MAQMQYVQPSFFDGTEDDMVKRSIDLIQFFEKSAIRRNSLGYIVGYSGGKDSDVLIDLFKKLR